MEKVNSLPGGNGRSVLMIIDGSSILHRAFYALPPFTNSSGVPTNAVYGFLTTLNKVQKEEKPQYLAVALDKSRQTFRSKAYEQYKATRSETPDGLKPQFQLLKKVLEAHQIPCFELEGYEADDLIGTLCHLGVERDLDCRIVTGDRDAWQLIRHGVEVLLTRNRQGTSEIVRYNLQTLFEYEGLRPDQVIELKGLMGDSSDNIPGVPGVGEKTALKLLAQFDTIENMYQHIDEVKGKLREKLENNKELAILSKDLAEIKCDVPIEPNWEHLKVSPPNWEAVVSIYKELEFNSLLKEINKHITDEPIPSNDSESTLFAGEAAGPVNEEKPLNISYVVIDTENKSQEVLQFMQTYNGPIGLAAAWDGNARLGKIRQLAVSCDEQIWVLPRTIFGSEGDPLPEGIAILKSLEALFLSQNTKLAYDGKAIWLLLNSLGINLSYIGGDALLANYLLNANEPASTPARLCWEFLQCKLDPECGVSTVDDEQLALGAKLLLDLMPKLEKKLNESQLLTLYQEVELPIIIILGKMEWHGVRVEPDILIEMAQRLEGEALQLQQNIHQMAGESFNINSTQQLGKILFEKLGLPVVKKTKTGYSTDVSVLEELSDRHPMIPKILEYRQIVKLKSTYVDGLLGLIEPSNKRVHTSFNQTVTATGRLSSTEPNLQNIPIRLPQGRMIRKAFVAPDDEWVLLAADYSQIELRILAHLSQDPSLIDAFQKNQDIHTRTASEVFGVSMNQVTSEQRRRAKAVNFGIVYGISDFGLGRDLNVPRAEAKAYIENYFSRYKGVKQYIDSTIAKARRDTYVTTMMGRRRHLPDLFHKSKVRQAFGERTAMNTPIQGTAADIIKAAMVTIDKLLAEEGFASRMLLQVHDELIFEVPRSELGALAPRIKGAMESAIMLDVPLIVDLKAGGNWYNMLPFKD